VRRPADPAFRPGKIPAGRAIERGPAFASSGGVAAGAHLALLALELKRNDVPVLPSATNQHFLFVLAQIPDLDGHLAIARVGEKHPVQLLDPGKDDFMRGSHALALQSRRRRRMIPKQPIGKSQS
jgi:hypothetical protein